jgi:hypothetical protein
MKVYATLENSDDVLSLVTYGDNSLSEFVGECALLVTIGDLRDAIASRVAYDMLAYLVDEFPELVSKLEKKGSIHAKIKDWLIDCKGKRREVAELVSDYLKYIGYQKNVKKSKHRCKNCANWYWDVYESVYHCEAIGDGKKNLVTDKDFGCRAWKLNVQGE